MQGLGSTAIETPATAPVLPAAGADTVFTPFADRAAAYKPVATDQQTYVLVFKQPVRGLAGRQVRIRGGDAVSYQRWRQSRSSTFRPSPMPLPRGSTWRAWFGS